MSVCVWFNDNVWAGQYMTDCFRCLRWRKERREDLSPLVHSLQPAATQTEWCSTWSNRRKGSLRRRGTERGSSSSSRAGCPLRGSRSMKGGNINSKGRCSDLLGNTNTEHQSTNWFIMTRSFSCEVLSECETFNFHSVPALMFQHPNDVNSCDTSTKGSVVNISFQRAEKSISSSVPQTMFHYFYCHSRPSSRSSCRSDRSDRSVSRSGRTKQPVLGVGTLGYQAQAGLFDDDPGKQSAVSI